MTSKRHINKTMDMAPTMLNNDIEVSLHRLSKTSSVYKEHCVTFPDINEKKIDSSVDSNNNHATDNHQRFFIMPTCQKSAFDLVNVGVEIEEEKDRLFASFTGFARDVVAKCESLGLWCDFIDPCSGYPMVHTDIHRAYDEVDNIQKLLKYRILPTNCCRVLHHPLWGSAVYPASIFIYIPQAVKVEIGVGKEMAEAGNCNADSTSPADDCNNDSNSTTATTVYADSYLRFILDQVLNDYMQQQQQPQQQSEQAQAQTGTGTTGNN